MAIPLIVAGALAAGAVAGGVAGAVGKVGKNSRNISGFNDQSANTGYDPNAPNYGGYAGGLGDRLSGLSNGAQQGTNRANDANFAQWGARGQMGEMADAMRARALGQTPSIAQMQADRQMGQASAEQASAAAGARGPAALALAQQNAAGNTAMMQSNISGQAQINAANERMQAEQNAFGAYGNMRSQDLGNEASNRQDALGYEKLQNEALGQSLNARVQNQAIMANSYSTLEGLRNQQSQANADRSAKWFDKIFPSDMNAKNYQDGGGSGDSSQMQQMMPLVMGAMGSSGGGAGMAGMFSSDKEAKQAAHLKGQADGLIRGYQAAMNAPTAVQVPGGASQPQPQGQDLGHALEMQARQDNRAALEQDFLDHERRTNGNAVEAAKIRGNFGEAPQMSASNASEAAKIRAGFERDAIAAAPSRADIIAAEQGGNAQGGQTPWWMSPVDQQSMGFFSDDRTKLAAAWDEGRQAALENIRKVERMDDRGRVEALRGDHAEEVGLVQGLELRGAGRHEAKPPTRDIQSFQRDNYPTGLSRPGVVQEKAADYIPHGPSTSPVAEANRTYEGRPYSYKEGFRPPEQAPGETNFGPTAQNMEQSPVAATAVKENPQTGTKVIDRDKAIKLSLSGISDLQKQQDNTQMTLAKLLRGRR